MEEIIKLTKNKELIVRKRLSHFLEKLLKFYKKDIKLICKINMKYKIFCQIWRKKNSLKKY